MPLSHNYLQEVSHFIPEVDSNKCVHARVEISNCKNCVDACPHSAWDLDDELLALDVGACDGCGLCVSACTEEAIKYKYDHKIKSYKESNISFYACESATHILSKDKNISCINVISLAELLSLYGLGVRTLVVSTGDCTDCIYEIDSNLEFKIKKLNLLLSSRGQAKVKLLKVDSKKFKAWQTLLPNLDEKNTRRGFLLNLLSSGAELVKPKEDNALLMSELLPINKQSANDAIYPFVPIIDELKCSACNACMQLCPHASLVLNQEQVCFEIKPENCTGCAICTDVCELDAISLDIWAKLQQSIIELASQDCTSCGIEYRLPIINKSDDKYCTICTKSNKNQNLYQVINI